MDPRDPCYKVVPQNVYINARDRLDREHTKDEFFTSLSSMQNEKSLGIGGFLCKFYNVMWSTLGGDFYSYAHEFFSIGSLSDLLNRISTSLF